MGRLRRSFAFMVVLAATLGGLTSHAVAQGRANAGRALVGTYDGGQIEIAAGLELRADGRFRYGLCYGALDEEAEGSWTVTDGEVFLTSGPVTPPRFTLVDKRDSPDGRLLVQLHLPKGMSGQYFRAQTRLTDGTTVDRQLTEEGEMPPIGTATRATSVTVLLPIASLSSGAVRLSGASGHLLRFRFEPHHLGRVQFVRTALQIEGGEIVLHRHDRTIRFRRLPTSKPPD